MFPYAQCDQQPDGRYVVTATTSHAPNAQDLPAGRISVAVPKGMTVVGGETFTPTDPDNPSAGGTFAFPTPPSPPRQISSQNFLKAVTDAEWQAFVNAAASNATFGRAKAVLDHSITITPTDGYFIQMMDAAVAANILTQARRDAIMAALTA